MLKEIIKRSSTTTTFVTALTGMAALNIGGMTLHKFAGIGLGTDKQEVLLEKVKRAKAKRNWLHCRRLIVDEVSMLDPILFGKLDYIGRHMRRSLDRPFGGIQLVLCGDFFQLPPVSRGGSAGLCFESKLWQEIFNDTNMVELRKVFRQEEEEFVSILREVRFNCLSDDSLARLESLQRPLDCSNDIIPTKLYSTNMDVDSVNERFLRELPGDPITFTAKDFPPDQTDELFMAQHQLVLKVKAQVMLIKNLDSTLVNGSRGVVKELLPSKNTVVVQFLNGEVRAITPAEWTKATAVGATTLAKRVQVPLKLAWAVTIHKSQGLTIDHLEVDLAGVFECGQAYVALSRARRLEGLRVLSLNPARIKSHPRVIEFYRHLATLGPNPQAIPLPTPPRLKTPAYSSSSSTQLSSSTFRPAAAATQPSQQFPPTPPLSSSSSSHPTPRTGGSGFFKASSTLPAPTPTTKVSFFPQPSTGLSDLSRRPLDLRPAFGISGPPITPLLPSRQPPTPPQPREKYLAPTYRNLPGPPVPQKPPLDLEGFVSASGQYKNGKE